MAESLKQAQIQLELMGRVHGATERSLGESLSSGVKLESAAMKQEVIALKLLAADMHRTNEALFRGLRSVTDNAEVQRAAIAKFQEDHPGETSVAEAEKDPEVQRALEHGEAHLEAVIDSLTAQIQLGLDAELLTAAHKSLIELLDKIEKDPRGFATAYAERVTGLQVLVDRKVKVLEFLEGTRRYITDRSHLRVVSVSAHDGPQFERVYDGGTDDVLKKLLMLLAKDKEIQESLAQADGMHDIFPFKGSTSAQLFTVFLNRFGNQASAAQIDNLLRLKNQLLLDPDRKQRYEEAEACGYDESEIDGVRESNLFRRAKGMASERRAVIDEVRKSVGKLEELVGVEVAEELRMAQVEVAELEARGGAGRSKIEAARVRLDAAIQERERIKEENGLHNPINRSIIKALAGINKML
jgi:hypothetical protein